MKNYKSFWFAAPHKGACNDHSKVLVLLLLFIAFSIHATSFEITARGHDRVRLLIACTGASSHDLTHVARRLKEDLSFSGQFDVRVRSFKKQPSQRIVQSWGVPLALFLQENAKKNCFDWWIYDTQKARMVKSSMYTKRGDSWREWAHHIADCVWPILTSEEGFFSTKISYCKDEFERYGRRVAHVCIADFDGSNEKIVVNTPYVNIAPRWGGTATQPRLFYSELAPYNTRLMMSDLHHDTQEVSSFDGFNMAPTCAPDGSAVAYCASRGDGECQLYLCQHGEISRLTSEGVNVSPTFGKDADTLYFCSDRDGGAPQLYKLSCGSGVCTPLTHEGYYATPSYNAKRDCLAYTKLVDGVMQVFSYDFTRDMHTQLTFDRHHKQECSWSPCGNYLLVAIGHVGASKLGIVNVLTGARRLITGENSSCSYPAWSPRYALFQTT